MILHESGLDEGLVWHFGNPAAEARRIASGDAVVGLQNREVIEVTGEDRTEFLHLISTAHMREIGEGSGAFMILDAQGRIQHVLHFIDDGESLLGWTEPGRADALVAHLNKMRFAMRVDAVRRDDLKLYWSGGKAPLPEGARVRDSELGGVDVFSPVDVETNVGTWAFDAFRIESGIPRIFVDTDDKTIPNEIGLYATHLNKGCYPGQETVAKVHTLGRPPRRLVMLHLDGSVSALPKEGAELLQGEKRVGFVGSSARHHELGPIALALVKRNVPVETELLADGIPAAQEIIVDPDVGLHVRPNLR